MSKRKPFNGDAGYVSSRRTDFGYVVIYDRENGGDWFDASTRWIARFFGISIPSAFKHVSCLERKGWIARTAHKARTIQIIRRQS